MGKEFLSLLDRSFPPSNPLHKLFTRQTVKLSYRCMPNMATSIARHNSKVLGADQQRVQPPGCNCKGGAASCPVQGVCKQEGVVYEACVKERVSGKTETYTGLTGRTFKQRWTEHKRDFEKTDSRTKIKLRSHMVEIHQEENPIINLHENCLSSLCSRHWCGLNFERFKPGSISFFPSYLCN